MAPLRLRQGSWSLRQSSQSSSGGVGEPAASALFKPGLQISRTRLARTHSFRGMHWFPSLAAEPGLSSVRRCNSVVGFPQAVLRPSSGPRVRQGPFARRELPRFITTTAPSDSRLGRQAVMVSRRSLIRIPDHQAGSLRFLIDLSTPAVPYHPGGLVRCICSLLHGRWQASTNQEGWPSS
jgi:hypothetical protein